MPNFLWNTFLISHLFIYLIFRMSISITAQVLQTIVGNMEGIWQYLNGSRSICSIRYCAASRSATLLFLKFALRSCIRFTNFVAASRESVFCRSLQPGRSIGCGQWYASAGFGAFDTVIVVVSEMYKSWCIRWGPLEPPQVLRPTRFMCVKFS